MHLEQSSRQKSLSQGAEGFLQYLCRVELVLEG